ncbi:Ion transport protein-domain-containing protein [Paraphysoderma sedebokerense]|nr:Ion transport protein-domain-containing protein [Paraphysoderma sedebokerense]
METSKEPTEIIEMHSENVQNTEGGDKTVPDHTINIKSVDDGQPNSLIVQKYQFLRDTCRLIIHSRPYIFVTCLVVLFNGAILATYTRKQPQTEWLRLVVQLDNYLSIAFIVDVLLKCIALGVRGVLSDPWYRMDVLVTALSCISWANALADLSPLRVLLLVKFLPRMSYFHHVGTILKALHRSLPLMRDIGILSLVFFLSWGIAGTKLYGGKLHQRCVFTNNGTILDETKMCSMNRALGYQCPAETSCLPVAPNPSEGIISFDNLLSSWLTIFQILTGEGWSSIMDQIKGSTGPASMVYFLAVIFIGNYILVQLLVSVVVNSLCSVIEESAENLPSPNSPDNNGSSFPVLSVDSPNGSDGRSASSGKSAIGNIDFRFTESEYQKLPALRQYAYRLICSKWFEFGVMSIIIANTVALAAHHHNMSPTFSFNLDIVNEVCTILFTIELVSKLVALFPRNYCKSTVNILDGLVTIVSLADLLSPTRQVSTLSIFRVFRAFLRTFRLLRLLRLSKPLLRLIKIIVDAWPLLRSLGAIWIIGVFVFACLGIQSFRQIKFRSNCVRLGAPESSL